MPTNLERILEQQLAGENRIARQIAAVESAEIDPILAQQATSTASQATADFLSGLVTPGSAPNIAAFAAGREQSNVAAQTSAQQQIALAEAERERRVSAFERELSVAREERAAQADLREEQAARTEAQSVQSLRLEQTEAARLTNERTEATQQARIDADNTESQVTIDTAPALGAFAVAQERIATQQGQANLDQTKKRTDQIAAETVEAARQTELQRTNDNQTRAVNEIAAQMAAAMNTLVEQKEGGIPSNAEFDALLNPAITNIIATDPALKDLPKADIVLAIKSVSRVKLREINRSYADFDTASANRAALAEDLARNLAHRVNSNESDQ